MNRFETSLIHKSTGLLALLDESLHCVQLSAGWRSRLRLAKVEALGQWNFVPSETHPIGGMEFMVTLILLMIYVAVKGNHGLQCDTSFRAPTPIAV